MSLDCLLVLNPRDIPECIDSLHALPIDKAYFRSYREVELIDAIAGVVESTDYEHYIAVSDDGVVPLHALDAIQHYLDLDKPVVTGYSNLAMNDWRVNLTKTPLRGLAPGPNAYDLYDWQEVASHVGPVPTFFTGMCLTGMRREMWQRFPFQCFGVGEHAGNASDFHLSQRLHTEAIPIVAPPEAFVLHVKERWNRPDGDHARRMRWDRPQEVVWEHV